MFDIVRARDLLSKLEADHTDFKAQPDSARHALNCIITAYHLHEWVWGDWLNADHATWKKLGIRDCKSFTRWLESEWHDFIMVQSLTNGAKHFIRQEMGKTDRIAGYGMGPYGVGPYGYPYLLIDCGDDAPERWKTAERLIDDAVAFWQKFFEAYQPEHPSTS